MKPNLLFRIALTLMLSFSIFSLGQTEPPKDSTVFIEMKDGQEFRGVIVLEDETSITLKTANGTLILDKSQIKERKFDDYTGDFRFPNSHQTRYFFGPSGKPIKKGEGYYQNLLLVGNFMNYGVTNHFSIGGGFEFISTMSGYPVWFITPKFGWNLTENWSIGTGIMIGGMRTEGAFGLPYAALTYGDNDDNITLGIGGATDFKRSAETVLQSPLIMISGTKRVSNGIALLSENYILTNSDISFFSIDGIRILSEKNAFDLGVILIPQATEGIPLPYVGYSRKF